MERERKERDSNKRKQKAAQFFNEVLLRKSAKARKRRRKKGEGSRAREKWRERGKENHENTKKPQSLFFFLLQEAFRLITKAARVRRL